MINRVKESGQTMLSDTKLLTQLQAGDATSFETLFLRHYDRIYGVLYRLLGNRDDAEDIAQQVFLKLYYAPKRIRVNGEETNLIGWLYRVAVNEGYNALRGQKRRQNWQETLTRWWPFEISDSNPAAITEQEEERASVRQVLMGMKARDAKLLLLRHSGLSYKELAVVLDVAPGSIGSLLTRAERAFQTKYRRAFPTTEDTHEQK